MRTRTKKQRRCRIGLRGQFGLLFLVTGIGIGLVTASVMALYVSYSRQTDFMDTLWGVAYLMVEEVSVTPEQLKHYALSGETDKAYEQLHAQMERARTGSKLIDNYFILCPLEARWVIGNIEGEEKKPGERVEDFDGPEWEVCRQVLTQPGDNYRNKGKEKTMGTGGDPRGAMKVSAYYPIEDGGGNVIAILGIEEYTESLSRDIKNSAFQATIYIAVLLLVQAAILLAFVQSGIIRSIRSLRDGVQQLADGRLDVAVDCKRRDEIGDITQGFNRMAAHISGHIQEMEALNEAYQKFVPPEMMGILHRESIVDVCLGDQAVIDLTLLVMEPKGARSVLPDLSSEQTFAYINGMFARTVPPVLSMGGSVWQHEKAAVHAVFQNEVKNALDAAIQAGERLREAGETVAAGISRGPVMVGIAGHERHTELISISEQKKVVVFLRDIARLYYASILIAGSTAAEIENFTEDYHVRFLGYIHLPGGGLEGIYDVFDADDDRQRRKKQQTMESFAGGVRLFTKGCFRESRESFIDVLRSDRKDLAAREYVALCSRAIREEKYRKQVWFAELKR